MITEDQVKDVIHEVYVWAGLIINEDHAREFIEWYNETHDQPFEIMDTYERGYVLMFIAQKVTSFRDWPCNGDDEAYSRKFFKELYANAKEHGIKIE